jgi:tetratricopeptide (TPR) repeat protein
VSKQLDADSRFSFAKRLAVAMEPKIMEGDATDCSRLAWLLISSGQEDRAAEVVGCGLRLDSNNEHCQNLNTKIWAPRLLEAKRNKDLERFAEALSHLSPYQRFDFKDVSEAANFFNLSVRDAVIPQDRKQLLARKLSTLMEARIAEANATDCSRLAWLLLQAGEQERASAVVDRGLELDPSNEHCQKLKRKVGGS